MEALQTLIESTGFVYLEWRMVVMWVIIGVLFYLAIAKNFEPLLLVPIGFGALLANLPTMGLINEPAREILAPYHGEVLSVEVQRGDEIAITPGMRDSEKPVVITLAVMEPDGSPRLDKDGEPMIKLVRATGEGTVSELLVQPGDTVYEGEALVDVAGIHPGGLFHYLYYGILFEIFPPLIFLGVGALTDFGPLIANPRTLLLGAAAQFGVFATFLGAVWLGFTSLQAAAIGIIGGADGPTSIFLANKLAPDLLAPIAVAAYSYMSLVPVIQPPIMRLLTSKAERKIRMTSLRPVSKLEKIIFALAVTLFCILLVPSSSPLIAMLMLGNFLRECGVTNRLSKAAQNEIINVTTIFLGTCVGITMTGDKFLQFETLSILALGVVAFSIATAAGILVAKFMNLFSKNKINPLIGSAGVSAVPMAARVSQVEGQKEDPQNFLLMHAMGPNVAGVIGTALVAGYFIAMLS
jgi:oxaloacetate decarboxylase beta subunit